MGMNVQSRVESCKENLVQITVAVFLDRPSPSSLEIRRRATTSRHSFLLVVVPELKAQLLPMKGKWSQLQSANWDAESHSSGGMCSDRVCF